MRNIMGNMNTMEDVGEDIAREALDNLLNTDGVQKNIQVLF